MRAARSRASRPSTTPPTAGHESLVHFAQFPKRSTYGVASPFPTTALEFLLDSRTALEEDRYRWHFIGTWERRYFLRFCEITCSTGEVGEESVRLECCRPVMARREGQDGPVENATFQLFLLGLMRNLRNLRLC